MRSAERHEVQLRAARIVSSLAARAPVRHPVVVALPPRSDPRAAARARPPDAAVDLMAARARPPSTEARINRAAVSSASRRSSSATSASRRHGESSTRPERFGEPHVPDAGDERLVEQRLAEPTACRRRVACARASRRCAAAARGCPARAARARACAARARGRSRAHPRRARRGARATACRAASPAASRGRTVQRPDMRRCERRTMPPSKRSTRFLPCASTDSSMRPSIRSATRSACARGCGDSASIRWPTSACSRRAARWRVSPSGTLHGKRWADLRTRRCRQTSTSQR